MAQTKPSDRRTGYFVKRIVSKNGNQISIFQGCSRIIYFLSRKNVQTQFVSTDTMLGIGFVVINNFARLKSAWQQATQYAFVEIIRTSYVIVTVN